MPSDDGYRGKRPPTTMRVAGEQVTLSPAARRLLVDLLLDSEVHRDGLPYTPQFDALLHRFTAETGLSPSPNEFWRALSAADKNSAKAEARSPPTAG